MLVCAATPFELDAVPDDTAPGNAGTERLVTGVGIPAALAALLTRFAAGPRPELIVNVGIAGAYPETGIAIGDIVLADGEVYGDVGFELPEPPGFRGIGESEFGRGLYDEPLPTVQPAGWFVAEPDGAAYQVHVARGCTVNACAGTDATGELRRRLFGAGFETMEGAAVAQAGRQFGVPVCEIRAVSNVAARRDMRPENIRLALQNLRHYLAACRRRNSDDG
jgi:futalosine hydrolase